MAMRSGMYSSNKRKKELMRQKKQEEKRQRRQSKGSSQEPEATAPVDAAPGPTAEESGPGTEQVSNE
ncbi:MAG: hypothetical protein HZA16_00585 [Nitrospirae bacterium]|nr:hypothetical protein [Nitrospirota bacterium]